jgi:hypothetical protein
MPEMPSIGGPVSPSMARCRGVFCAAGIPWRSVFWEKRLSADLGLFGCWRDGGRLMAHFGRDAAELLGRARWSRDFALCDLIRHAGALAVRVRSTPKSRSDMPNSAKP